MNIPIICAAGNTGQGGVNWPAAFNETIAVAAYDKYGNVASFSSRGEKVEWAAPGVDIYSTFLNNSYASLSGTSMACPFIAGVVCLMLAKHKKQEENTGKNDCKTVAQIREHLLKYTDDKGVVGKDNDWGYGVIDVDRLIGGDQPDPKPDPKPDPIPEKPPPNTPPKKEDKNKLYIAIGVGFILVSSLFIYLLTKEEVEIPNPPYIDEDGNINWDEKFNQESNPTR